MQIDSRQTELIRLLATGTTLTSAAGALAITRTRANQLLRVACRKIGLPDGVAAIRSDPAAYLAKLDVQNAPHAPGLRVGLERDLVRLFKFAAATDLTPKLLANYSATQLRSLGLTTTAVTEIHRWLRANGLQLKRGPLLKGDLKELAQAADLLQAYHFDVTAARQQLDAEKAGSE